MVNLEEILKIKKTRKYPVCKLEGLPTSEELQKLGVYFKETYAHRLGIQEYKNLRALHSVLPDNVPDAYAVVIDKKGRVNGYLLEFVDGVTLYNQILENGPLPQKEASEISHQLDYVSKVLSENRVCHGDMSPINMPLKKDRSGSIHLMLMDPTSENYRESSQAFEETLEKDRKAIEEIKRSYLVF